MPIESDEANTIEKLLECVPIRAPLPVILGILKCFYTYPKFVARYFKTIANCLADQHDSTHYAFVCAMLQLKRAKYGYVIENATCHAKLKHIIAKYCTLFACYANKMLLTDVVIFI